LRGRRGGEKNNFGLHRSLAGAAHLWSCWKGGNGRESSGSLTSFLGFGEEEDRKDVSYFKKESDERGKRKIRRSPLNLSEKIKEREEKYKDYRKAIESYEKGGGGKLKRKRGKVSSG